MTFSNISSLPLAGAYLALAGLLAMPAAAQSSAGSREFQRAELSEVSPPYAPRSSAALLQLRAILRAVFLKPCC
jgi:hypothetical protein